ncbi:hypothetical protein BD410DRAFT_784212 [Rickenella mellea]|uniref:Cryptic loci regulator 2 N-terminal domain-containing protein n=1 Tax=Rickenella mellea TaxID=50990 RepID=A0A4Y7QFY9_9AGAM|nr:hypothetical protein BD410DRAFT_784212 [Rickenella mellea]
MPSMAPHFSVQGEYVSMHLSDGNPRRWPRERKLADPDSDTIDYLVPADPNDEHDAHSLLKWKCKIGGFLMDFHKRAEPNQNYYLTDFPDGYRLFVHRKGSKANPRRDCYLYGSANVTVFRSAAEFFFHAKWIVDGCQYGNNRKPRACGCKYCDPTANQAEISAKWDNRHPKQKSLGRSRPSSQNAPRIMRVKTYPGIGGAVYRD